MSIDTSHTNGLPTSSKVNAYPDEIEKGQLVGGVTIWC